jgi:hypothetical protein
MTGEVAAVQTNWAIALACFFITNFVSVQQLGGVSLGDTKWLETAHRHRPKGARSRKH